MKTSTQIWIDKRLIKPFVSATNLLVRLVGKLLRIDHSLDESFQTIAVCKYKGLGSIIQAIPLLQSLKERYPDAELIFVTTKANQELIQQIPLIDQSILLDDGSVFKLIKNYPRFIAQLISSRIGVFVDLEIYSDFSSLTTTLSLAKNRLGYYLKASHYRLGVYTHMMYFNTRVPIAHTYLQMSRLLGAKEPTLINGSLSFDNQLFNKLRLNNKYILINVNASDLRIERRWGQKNFIALINTLKVNYPNHQLVLIGSPGERDYVASICDDIPSDTVLNLAGQTSLKELLSVIKNASLVITNDTGPMHMASALGVSTVALFGPCSPDQYAVHNKVIPVYQNLYCSPCVHEFDVPPCHGDNQCMKQIRLESVMDAVVKALSDQSNSTTSNIPFRAIDGTALGQVTRN